MGSSLAGVVRLWGMRDYKEELPSGLVSQRLIAMERWDTYETLRHVLGMGTHPACGCLVPQVRPILRSRAH